MIYWLFFFWFAIMFPFMLIMILEYKDLSPSELRKGILAALFWPLILPPIGMYFALSHMWAMIKYMFSDFGDKK